MKPTAGIFGILIASNRNAEHIYKSPEINWIFEMSISKIGKKNTTNNSIERAMNRKMHQHIGKTRNCGLKLSAFNGNIYVYMQFGLTLSQLKYIYQHSPFRFCLMTKTMKSVTISSIIYDKHAWVFFWSTNIFELGCCVCFILSLSCDCFFFFSSPCSTSRRHMSPAYVCAWKSASHSYYSLKLVCSIVISLSLYLSLTFWRFVLMFF